MMVSNLPMRGAYMASRLTITEVARNMGWKLRGNKPDTARLERMLGLRHNGTQYQDTVSEENALLIADALHLDPRDVGV